MAPLVSLLPWRRIRTCQLWLFEEKEVDETAGGKLFQPRSLWEEGSLVNSSLCSAIRTWGIREWVGREIALVRDDWFPSARARWMSSDRHSQLCGLSLELWVLWDKGLSLLWETDWQAVTWWEKESGGRRRKRAVGLLSKDDTHPGYSAWLTGAVETAWDRVWVVGWLIRSWFLSPTADEERTSIESAQTLLQVWVSETWDWRTYWEWENQSIVTRETSFWELIPHFLRLSPRPLEKHEFETLCLASPSNLQVIQDPLQSREYQYHREKRSCHRTS